LTTFVVRRYCTWHEDIPPPQPGERWCVSSITRSEYCFVRVPTPKVGETIYYGSFVPRQGHPGYLEDGKLCPVLDQIVGTPLHEGIYPGCNMPVISSPDN
jgi:hypothetical protein